MEAIDRVRIIRGLREVERRQQRRIQVSWTCPTEALRRGELRVVRKVRVRKEASHE